MASKYLQKFPVPEDFPDLLHDFAREVLRDQPENIYEYGAQYFRAMYMVSRTINFTDGVSKLSQPIILGLFVTDGFYLIQIGSRIQLWK